MRSTVSFDVSFRRRPLRWVAVAVIACGLTLGVPAEAQYRSHIGNDLEKCRNGDGPAVRVTVSGIKSSRGTIRVQSYRGTQADWLAKGRWLSRIELPARAGSMNFCVPVPSAGSYGIAVRHDVNGNGETDLSQDGGGMSNNPSINILNLGKPSFRKTAFSVGNEVKPITIVMKYM